MANKAHAALLKDRRHGHLDQEEARELFDEAEDIREATSIDYLAGAHCPLMRKLFGDEWWHSADDATEPNPDYEHLERIILAVQQAPHQEESRQVSG